MKQEELELLIKNAGLNHIATFYSATFLASFHFATQLGTRIQCKIPAEFSQMSPEAARTQINGQPQIQRGDIVYPAAENKCRLTRNLVVTQPC
jgi:hypothetical protein